jgi:hypothetical protein
MNTQAYLLLVIFFLQIVGNILTASIEQELFAGAGLITFGFDLDNNSLVSNNCTTYDDCYNLLCYYIDYPLFPTLIKVNPWNLECSHLKVQDNRHLFCEFDIYYTNGTVKESRTVGTVTAASKFLCDTSKNDDIYLTHIAYFGIEC